MHEHEQSYARDGRAVSPVIGVVLMVAVTIILSAVIGTFVFGLTPETALAPSAAISIEGNVGADNVTLVHGGGERLELGEVTILVNGSEGDGNGTLEGTFDAGERVLVGNLNGAGATTVTLRHDPSGEILIEREVFIG